MLLREFLASVVDKGVVHQFTDALPDKGLGVFGGKCGLGHTSDMGWVWNFWTASPGSPVSTAVENNIWWTFSYRYVHLGCFFFQGASVMDFLKNISVKLHATGPAAVLIAWCLAVAALGIFGMGDGASKALTVLMYGGALILAALASRS